MTNFRKACYIEALENMYKTNIHYCTATAILTLIDNYGYRFSEDEKTNDNFKRSQVIFDVLEKYVEIEKMQGKLMYKVTSFGIPRNICAKLKQKALEVRQLQQLEEQQANDELAARVNDLF